MVLEVLAQGQVIAFKPLVGLPYGNGAHLMARKQKRK
jgi:hypothetical protein